MKGRYVYVGAVVVALAISWALWHPVNAKADRHGPNSPRFVVDPFWPKPLPAGWVTGEIGGTCVDSNDHVFIYTRGFQSGGLVSPENVGGAPKSFASPPVIELDQEGNVVNSWGNPSLVPAGQPHAGQNAVLPNGTHGCFVDFQNNVWLGGNGDGVVQKYSHDGKKLLQIGTKFLCDSPTGACGNFALEGSSQTLLNQPADINVDPANGDIYIADGYGNHRVVVFHKDGSFKLQMGGVGTGLGQFFSGDGGHPHCVNLGKDGLVYACDRGNDRINVYDKMGKPLYAIPVVPGTNAIGTAGSAWDVDFSPDRQQTFLYESDGGNEIMWIFDHAAKTILSGFGRPGHGAGEFTFLHMMAVSSRGDLFVGETIGGRRIQKFMRDGDVPQDELQVVIPAGNPNLRLLHYDPVKHDD